MRDVNWWLMTLAFLLGLVLTLGLMIRRVTREVPVTRTLAAGVAAGSGAAAKLSGAAQKVERVVEEAGAKAGATVERAAEKIGDTITGKDILEEDPYGSGSIRVTRRIAGPAGYTVKGDKDTHRYFTPGSPDYGTVEAEVWFVNEQSAEKAGFLRWDAAAGAVATAAGAVAATFASADDVPTGPHGKGSAAGNADGSGPAGWTIKGNADSMLFHTTDSPWYGQTIAEVWFVDEESARNAGFTRWDQRKGDTATVTVAAIADVPAGPYGKGSAKSGADGSGPAGWLIKGNADSMLYHPPTSSAYSETVAEVWFFDEETAQKAGFEPWDKNFR